MEQEINDIGQEVILIYNINMRSFEKISFAFGICFSMVIILFSGFQIIRFIFVNSAIIDRKWTAAVPGKPRYIGTESHEMFRR